MSIAHALFFFNDTATTEIYTLSLHDALPICCRYSGERELRMPRPTSMANPPTCAVRCTRDSSDSRTDRKSTRLNSSHANISYAVFCLKKIITNARVRQRRTYPFQLMHSATTA